MTAGLSLGRYRLERIAGRGGMAIVYLAEDVRLGRRVAVKVLAEHLAHEQHLRRRFAREARLAARLSHPNVVQVFDVVEDARPHIVMEYVGGGSLADLISRERRLPEAAVVELALPICAALEHAHEAGLVHRDVKPGNVLLTEDGATPKLADFGIAQAAQATRLTQAGTVLGTAAYLAPEQTSGLAVTPAADVYSLGAVLYELLTGRTPFRFETLPELVAKQQTGEFPPLRELVPDVSPQLAELVTSCLASDPGSRPSAAAEVARRLAQAGREPPTRRLRSLRPSGPPGWSEAGSAPASGADALTVPRPARPDRRARRRLWPAVVAAVAALGAGIGLAATSDGKHGAGGAGPGPVVTPVEPAGDPAERARNLAAWLRAQAR